MTLQSLPWGQQIAAVLLFNGIHVVPDAQQKSDGKAPPQGVKSEFPEQVLESILSRENSPREEAALRAVVSAKEEGTVAEIAQIVVSLDI